MTAAAAKKYVAVASKRLTYIGSHHLICPVIHRLGDRPSLHLVARAAVCEGRCYERAPYGNLKITDADVDLRASWQTVADSGWAYAANVPGKVLICELVVATVMAKIDVGGCGGTAAGLPVAKVAVRVGGTRRECEGPDYCACGQGAGWSVREGTGGDPGCRGLCGRSVGRGEGGRGDDKDAGALGAGAGAE